MGCEEGAEINVDASEEAPEVGWEDEVEEEEEEEEELFVVVVLGTLLEWVLVLVEVGLLAGLV